MAKNTIGSNKKFSPLSTIKEFTITVIYAIIITTIFKSFVYDPYHIPSSSMTPNLIIGDKIFVNKFRYGYGSASFPFGLVKFQGRMASKHQPKRGDVVVFVNSQEDRVFYIKRLIGLPGDVIRVKNHTPYINGKPFKQTRICDLAPNEGNNYNPFPVSEYVEETPEGMSYKIFKAVKPDSMGDMATITIPQGRYLMMGDNRPNSADSRFASMGLISYDNLVGRADLIFFSSPHFPLLALFMPWEIKGSRIFKPINQNISLNSIVKIDEN
jgi:signal peptidase I